MSRGEESREEGLGIGLWGRWGKGIDWRGISWGEGEEWVEGF